MASDVEPPSALDRALRRVGDRWSLLVVAALLSGPGRFADLVEAVPGIATNVLSQRLKHLEAERLVLAVRYSERPVRYAYELTEAGRSLAGTLRLLTQWSADHGDADGGVRPPVHDTCGTAVEATWWCPTCDQRIEVGRDEPRWL
ncbi:MAG: helix-turn-helix transcriptional regulator [Actinomycetota bacterium]|nr:helix-turn-helix transcriptional regulator [Actinomycetota bacterium]